MQDFPKDIVNMIYRFVWTSFIGQCSSQYHESFRSSFFGDYLVNKQTKHIFNDRTTMANVRLACICNIHTGNKTNARVPKNYII